MILTKEMNTKYFELNEQNNHNRKNKYSIQTNYYETLSNNIKNIEYKKSNR